MEQITLLTIVRDYWHVITAVITFIVGYVNLKSDVKAIKTTAITTKTEIEGKIEHLRNNMAQRFTIVKEEMDEMKVDSKEDRKILRNLELVAGRTEEKVGLLLKAYDKTHDV